MLHHIHKSNFKDIPRGQLGLPYACLAYVTTLNAFIVFIGMNTYSRAPVDGRSNPVLDQKTTIFNALKTDAPVAIPTVLPTLLQLHLTIIEPS